MAVRGSTLALAVLAFALCASLAQAKYGAWDSARLEIVV